MRQKAKKENKVFCFKSPWRNKQPSSTVVKPVIRIKTPESGTAVINDTVQGKIKVDNSEIDDFVILRSDKTPTYMLAVVVDDHNIGITHIIRGDDHLTNSFKQQIIYESLEWNIPKFVHIPLIYGSDGAKMSKRHGATSVTEYKDMGYLPQTLRNYLLRLGWSHGNNEIISDEQAKNWFNLETIGKSPARFDFAKLDNLNKHYIKELDDEQLFELISSNNNLNKEKAIKVLPFVKERASNLKDLFKMVMVYNDDYKQDLEKQDLELINKKREIIVDLFEIIQNIDDFNHNIIKEEINKFSLNKGLKMKDFAPTLRIILTFSSKSAGGIFNIVEILGKKEVIRRFKVYLP